MLWRPGGILAPLVLHTHDNARHLHYQRSSFKSVYLHGLVLDEHGVKMSKNKGNVVNPMNMIDEYGSDALRMGNYNGQSAGNNQPFTTDQTIGA